MSGDGDTWRRLQQGLQEQVRKGRQYGYGGGGGGGNPRNVLGGLGLLLVLGGGAVVVNNALFNGGLA